MISPQPVLLIGSSSSGPFNANFAALSQGSVETIDSLGLVVASFGYAFNNTNQSWFAVETQSTAADALPTNPEGSLLTISQGFGFNGATFDRLRSAGSNADGLAAEAQGQQTVIAQLFGWNGASFDRVRVANVSHTALVTAAGTTPVWTPTAGTTFRLMGYTIDVAGTLAATGVQTIQLADGATVFKNHLADVIETTAVGDAGSTTNIGADLGQGFLSAAANNVLNIVLGSAMVTGGVAINVWGTEE
jgi:hypothetical protein